MGCDGAPRRIAVLPCVNTREKGVLLKSPSVQQGQKCSSSGGSTGFHGVTLPPLPIHRGINKVRGNNLDTALFITWKSFRFRSPCLFIHILFFKDGYPHVATEPGTLQTCLAENPHTCQCPDQLLQEGLT